MTWNIDSYHAGVNFSVRHMMITHVRGHFDKVTGTVELDEAAPERSSVEVQIEAASINTGVAMRDQHLRSADFLDAANYPYLTFKSTRVERSGDNTGRIIGDLTIRGVSREVTLDVEYNGRAKNPMGSLSAGFTATTQIDRKDWRLTYNTAIETGGWAVGDIVKIDLEVELIAAAEELPMAA